MTLASGTKLGRYEIRSKLGAGGMGEVYHGRDTQLGRDVAVKVLPTTVSTDVERLRRFEQEACAASALNHPNILIVHDIGAHDGTTYVVSELLEGETLRKRIAGTPLAQRRAIDYALQIAHGLAAAHEKGIIHRDLKPDNIFVTNDGRVKILDFGLAKLTQLDGNQVQTDVPTRRVDTDPGVVMGTVGYMAPEQLKGQPVDQRSDIFAFGAVLYEMLSGQRAFHGESAAETMSAILKEDPPELSDTNKSVSPALERLVNHCLEKNPEGRFHSARDLAFALEALSGGSLTNSGETIPLPSVVMGSRHGKERWIWISLVALLLLSSITFALLYFKRAPANERVVKFSILPPEKVTLPGSVAAFAVSPDGLRLALIGTSEGQTYIWVRSLDSVSAQLLPGTDGALQAGSLFWSPDSRFIGYFTAGKLLKVEASGSAPQTICNLPAPARGGAWNRDGVIVFGLTDGPLYKVSAGGGEATPMTTIHQSERSHRWPVFLPDDRHLLYVVNNVGGADSGGLYVGDLDSKDTTRLIQTTTNALYAPPGFLLFLRNEALMVQRFNADTRQLSGEPVSIVDHVQNNPGIARAAFSISGNGVLAFRSGGGLGNQPIWLDRSGKEIGTLGARGIYINVSLSPDEKRAAQDIGDPQTGRNDIWLFDLSRGVPTRFTTDSAADSFPTWSPDGNQIVFASTREGVFNLYLKKANGLENEQPLLKSDETKVPDDWSHDGKFIIYESRNPKTKLDLWLLPMSGPRDPISFLKTDFNEQQARFSPDGKWVAYTSDISGKPEVYVQTFPASGGPVRVSTNGGAQPLWRGDGNELFYIATDRRLMAVEVKLGAAFEAKTPQPLFLTRVLTITEFRSHYAVTRDGQRFLVNSLIEETFTNPITLVVNWTTGLQK